MLRPIFLALSHRRSGVNSNLSLKLSQLGLDVDEALCEALLRRVLARAGTMFVRVDMESSQYTDRTLRLVEALWAGGLRNVGVVIQSYLRRSEADVERMIDAAKRAAAAGGIAPDRFEFQMLYGIRRDLQARLRREGYRVRVYVPFGEEWYPYFMRRLAERPANVMFVLKSVLRE